MVAENSYCSLFVTLCNEWSMLHAKHYGHLTFQREIKYWGMHLGISIVNGLQKSFLQCPTCKTSTV